MKLKNLIIAGLAILPLAFIASTAQAQTTTFTTNNFTFEATALLQNTTNDNGKVTKVGAFTKNSISTKQLLAWLAQDENAEGNFGALSFTSSVTLNLISSNGVAVDLQVVNHNNLLLVDVSDLISIKGGTNIVVSGTTSDSTGLNVSHKELRLVHMVYDDSNVNGGTGVTFNLTGVESSTVTDTTPNRSSGVYKESISADVSGSGDGSFQGTPFIVTGGWKYSEKSTLTDAP